MRKASKDLVTRVPDHKESHVNFFNLARNYTTRSCRFFIPLRAPADSIERPGESRGCFILNAALELSKNQITYMFTEAKNTGETIQLIELLRQRYTGYRRMFLSWDAAPWHLSKKLRKRIDFLNEWAPHDRAPLIQVLPLPTSAQFLNVIESVFSGLARAVLHSSDYASVEDAKAAVALHLEDRNRAFKTEPRRAGKLIWKKERVRSEFLESNNCKDLRYS